MPHRSPQEFRTEQLFDARDEMHLHINTLLNRILDNGQQNDEDYLRFLLDWVGKYTDIDATIESHTQSLIVDLRQLCEREIQERDSILDRVERLRQLLDESRNTARNTKAKA